MERKIKKSMKDTCITKIQMKHFEHFSKSIEEEKWRCDSIKSPEIRKLQNNILLLKIEIVNLYNEAKNKYIKIREDDEEYCSSNDSSLIRKKSQNSDLRSEIKKLKIDLRKQGSKNEKIGIIRKINEIEKIVSFNKSSVDILADFTQADTRAKFEIFNELSNDVEKAFSGIDFVNDDEIGARLLDFLSIMGGLASVEITALFAVINSVKDVMGMIDSNNGNEEMYKNIDKADESIQKLCQLEKLLWVTMLLIKIYLEDYDFIRELLQIKDEKIELS